MKTRRIVWSGGCLAVLVTAATYVAAVAESRAAASARTIPAAPRAIGKRAPEGSAEGAASAQRRGVGAPQSGVIVDQYCVTCHNDKDEKGGLSLEGMNIGEVGEDVVTWEKVVRKLRVRFMPPHGSDKPRPDDATYEALISYLESSLDRVAEQRVNPGRPATFHRLNRTEYQNAIRDLLAVDIDAASLLPGDDASYGFDNVNVGELSPTLLDRYVSTARRVSRLAVGSPLRAPGAHTVILPLDLTQNDQVDEALPIGTRGGTIFRHTFPQDGEYLFQIRLARDRDDHIEGMTEPVQIELALDGERLRVFTLTPPRRVPGQNAAYEAKIDDMDGGLKGRFSARAGPRTVAVAFLKKPSVLSEVARQPFMADYNGRSMAAVFSVSVAGPYNATGPGETPSRRRVFICRPATEAEDRACARTILSTLARRAYRRPPTEPEVQDLVTFYERGRGDGSGFETGIEMAIRALIVSPNFLFRIEREPAGIPPRTAYRLSDLELASRLSFFLWSSIPDDQLLEAAARGTLKTPSVLERQVRRMLADARSDALVNNFAAQWLHLRNLSAATPDPRLFPDFDDNLRRAFRRETELLFESIKNDDRSVLDLLRANYTFVNERLAKHYGIPNVYGSHFRRVTLPTGSPRAGLLGHATVLTVTSYADRTSPVLRGKWILENIVGMAPPPPPPDIPPLKDKEVGQNVLTMRQRIAQHREDPACAGCHNLMDPIGLSTENFDAIGRWRAREAGVPIDASGSLPDGVTFEGVEGLRRALLRRPELFVSTATEKLLTYAIGRGLGGYDAPAVRAIVRGARGTHYRFSSLVLGVVNSAPFQMRRSQ